MTPSSQLRIVQTIYRGSTLHLVLLQHANGGQKWVEYGRKDTIKLVETTVNGKSILMELSAFNKKK